MSSAAQRDPRPPRRPASARRALAVGAGVLLLAVAVAGGAILRSAGQDGARPLPGVPLQGRSGLRLLVANGPTVIVLDVDTGATRPVTGLPAGGDRSTHVEAVGSHAVVVSRRDCRSGECNADPIAYLVRHGETAASRLAAALDVEPARDGRGVWLLTRQDVTHCSLGQVGLDGRQRLPARPMACDAVLIGDIPAGLLVYGPASGNGGVPTSALVTADGTVRQLPEAVDGVAGGDQVLSTVEPGRLVALTDLRSGARHQLPWPSTLDDHVMGLVATHPHGRLATAAFYPARSREVQTLDVWLLDLTTRRWRQLPDMPLRLGPSKPQLRWTADGRLLLLAEVAGGRDALVAAWRPGQPRVAVRRVALPESVPDRGGFRFAIW